MKKPAKGPLADGIALYLAHKRSLGKELAKVEPMLLLLDGNLLVQGVAELRQITAAHINAFVASRPRRSPRSYNGLIGAIRGLLDWMVVHEVLPESPLRCETRRVTPPRQPFLFNPDQARRLLEVAEQLPSNPRAQTRGETYKMIFALLYGLGLRVGEVSRLCRKDIDLDNQLLIIRQTKFGKDRLVPFGPKMARAITGFLDREESRFGPIPPDCSAFSFDKRKRTPIGTNTISWAFHKLLPALQLTVNAGVVAPRESAGLASKLIEETFQKQIVLPGQLTIHADRGSFMRSKPVALLLADLSITKTHSRPYTSNDNPYSESQFRTMKYRPEFPDRFGCIQDSRAFCQPFFAWYNDDHRHSGIGMMTPAMVHYGQAPLIREKRQTVLDAAYLAHPDRFVRRPPTPLQLSKEAWINKPKNSDQKTH